MAGGYTTQPPDGRAPRTRARGGRIEDAELLAPPEAAPVQLTRSMFSQPAPRPAPAPLTNHHLKKAARMNAGGSGGGAAATTAGGAGAGGVAGGGAAAARARSARSARSAAASSVRGGRAAFSVVSDEEVIDVDGEPTTLADDDMDLARGGPEYEYDNDEEYDNRFQPYGNQHTLRMAPHPHHAPPYGNHNGPTTNGHPGHPSHSHHHAPPHHHAHHHTHMHGPHRPFAGMGAGGAGGVGLGGGHAGDEAYGGGAGMYGAYGGGGVDVYGYVDPLEELEADTPAVRLAEVTADLAEAEAQKGRTDPWVVVDLARLALGHAKVVWRTMPVTVREEPLLLAKAHFALARAYQGVSCDKQASEHGRQALAVIPADSADKEAARALRAEVQVMRAESLLSSSALPTTAPEAAAGQARKALGLLVRAAGMQEPVAWTQEEVDENEEALPGHVRRDTIAQVRDMGVAALMAQCHGVLAESKLRAAEAERAESATALRCADEAASRQERRTERGDAFYSPEQMDKYRQQERAFREEAQSHQQDSVRLGGEAERAYEAAVYCLNHVIDEEGRRLEDAVGREGKQAHPTFRALWHRSLDFMAGMAEAYALQGKSGDQLSLVNEILTAFAQYGGGGWLPPARHIRALKDKGALLVAAGDYDGALECYEELTRVVGELFREDVVRREVQTAEVLKLRGDVALASGDFRTAQHLFNQALELYQRNLGVQAGVAQDLLHRIDEVKAYLADTRVMGRLASFPGRAPLSSLGGAMSTSAVAAAAGAAGPASAAAASAAASLAGGDRADRAASVASASVAASLIGGGGGGGGGGMSGLSSPRGAAASSVASRTPTHRSTPLPAGGSVSARPSSSASTPTATFAAAHAASHPASHHSASLHSASHAPSVAGSRPPASVAATSVAPSTRGSFDGAPSMGGASMGGASHGGVSMGGVSHGGVSHGGVSMGGHSSHAASALGGGNGGASGGGGGGGDGAFSLGGGSGGMMRLPALSTGSSSRGRGLPDMHLD